MSLKIGCCPAVLLENLDNLLEELVARILRLAKFVDRVLAMFADHQHGIDGQFIAAATKRFGDRWDRC